VFVWHKATLIYAEQFQSWDGEERGKPEMNEKIEKVEIALLTIGLSIFLIIHWFLFLRLGT